MPLSFDPIDEARRNWDEHGWEAGEAMVVATSITRAHQILLGRINATLAEFGLTFSRFEVLALLCFSREGELPMGKIGDRLQVHPTSVTSLVKRLVSDGLVSRIEHPDDGRSRLIRLETTGRDLAQRCASALAAQEFGISGIDSPARETLIELLGDLRYESGDWV